MASREEFEELVGTGIGDYVIDGYVGAGGQAVVYSAHSQQVGGKYALKIFGLLDSVRGGLEGGLSEAKKQSLVDHPAVVKVSTPGIGDVDFRGETRQVLFLPMAFSVLGNCERESPFAGRPLSELDFKAMINLLDGLSHIHAAELTHNDIKPANILKFQERVDGEDRTTLRITDFGIAKVLRAIRPPGGEPSGFTPSFMSPEQMEHNYSEKGDIYSMGATLYHMVTGECPISTLPADSGNLLAWQRAHQAYPRPNAHKANAFCPPRLALLIMRMMSVEPKNRPELAECIEELRKLTRLLRGRRDGHAIPSHLREALDASDFPLHCHSEFRGIFKPEVHSVCGSTLFVLRLKMRHPVLKQYKRLVRAVSQQLADSFCMYETWGTYDINMFVWSDAEEIEKLVRNLAEQFPESEPQVAAAGRVHHFHGSNHTPPESLSPVMGLAVQEGIEIPGFDANAYLCSTYPADMPERSVRAFTYVEAADDANRLLFRKAIAEHIRETLDKIWRERPQDFRRMTLIELAANNTLSHEFSPTAVIVDFVATEYRYLTEVPTAIIESLHENAVKTITCLETRRIMIQSDKILL